MKGQTLWDRLTTQIEPEEFQHYNPLKAKIGSSVDINLPDYTNLNFFVREIHEVNRVVDGTNHQFCDYVLIARRGALSLNTNDDVLVRIRVNPIDSGYHVLLLRLYDEIAYDQGFFDLVTTTEQFHVDDKDNNESVDYWRPSIDENHRLRSTWETDLVIVKEIDRKIGAINAKMDYWDFSRLTKDEASQEYEQFLFIEMDKDNGMFQLWQGEMIDPSRVVIV